MRPVIHFYLDFLSPYGFLARGQLLQLAQGRQATVAYHAVDLAALKRAAGNTGPPNRAIPPKIAYLTEDIQRWARRYGLSMVRTLPGADTSRLNMGLLLAAQRASAPEYVLHAWNCVWRDGLDPGLTSTVTELAARMGWKSADLRGFVEDATTQRRYLAETDAAIALGVFGVPTFIVDGVMWWGNDRLDFLAEHLAEAGRSSHR